MKSLLLSLLLAGSVLAQQPAPCASAEHRAFDFWAGEWRVETAAGKVAGHNSIRLTHDGCVLEERWRGNGGVVGSSVNIYDAATKRWHQTWVDNRGNLLLIEGGIVDGAMRLGNASNRITYTRLEGGRVRQVWEQADAAGKWTVAFDGIYIPEKK
jgi:hypothetical protein